jgi:hypothetical protein
MADKTPEQEPSIEEILASIRQIISDDDEKESAVNGTPEPQSPPDTRPELPVAFADDMPKPAPADDLLEEDDDVLELTEIVDADPDEKPDFGVGLEESGDAFSTAAPAEEIEMPMPKQAMQESISSAAGDILTEAARSATIASMAKLAGNMPVTRHREYGNITLEDLVREMLHPMLKDWLSDNLPPMVERMVQKELEKLARQAQDV